MDKGGQNSCSLRKIFFGPAPYVLSFPKWWKTDDSIWCLENLENTEFFQDYR